jgi:hypothetical protein
MNFPINHSVMFVPISQWTRRAHPRRYSSLPACTSFRCTLPLPHCRPLSIVSELEPSTLAGFFSLPSLTPSSPPQSLRVPSFPSPQRSLVHLPCFITKNPTCL